MRAITPQPGYTIADVEAVLLSRQFAFADCYTISPRYGSPVRLTTRMAKVTVIEDSVSVTYDNSGLLQISGLRLKMGIGVEVDEQEMEMAYASGAELWGIPIAKAVRLGRLDGATISRDRYIAAGPSSPWMGSMKMFRGRVSTADRIDRSGATLKVKSDLILLNSKVPQDLYQPGCNHVVYDEGCTLNRESFRVNGVVLAGSTPYILKATAAIPQLALGSLYIDTLEGITLVRTVRAVSGTDIQLAYPLDFDPVPGMAFHAYQGCDRTRPRCVEFGNEAHFKGFPYVPVAETAV